MSFKINSLALVGYDSVPVSVEIDLIKGDKSALQIIGLPDTAVKESKERVKAALKNIGLSLESTIGVINLAPGDVKKEGAIYDLPIALGILGLKLKLSSLSDYAIIGELSLSGEVRAVKGALAYALQAKAMGLKGIILPKDNLAEASWVEDFEIIGLEHLSQHKVLFSNPGSLSAPKTGLSKNDTSCDVDFKDILGQNSVKRAFEIAAAGQHHILLSGPPGIGKTLLSRAFRGLLPPMDSEEKLETMRIHSLVGLELKGEKRPFRAPHHTISNAGLIGGSQKLLPGEISLAHNGVLFLDELPEFKRSVLEMLRQPMEDRHVTISRAKGTSTYPAKFLLVATMNPCPCGFLGHPKKPCKDSEKEIARYQGKLSGPLMDRIDMKIDVSPVSPDATTEGNETSEEIMKRIVQARKRQKSRFEKLNLPLRVNQEMGPREIQVCCPLCPDGKALVKQTQEALSLSHRAVNKLLKVSRSIADLEGADQIHPSHLLEALTFREPSAPASPPF